MKPGSPRSPLPCPPALSISDLVMEEIPAAADLLSRLDLMRRYERTEQVLSRSLTAALSALSEPQNRIIVARTEPSLTRTETSCPNEPAEMAGLAWFAVKGTFLLGGYLKLLAVFSPFQRKGIGQALLAEAEKQTRACSSRMFLLVSSFNEQAQRFYEAMGYNRAGLLEDLVVPGIDELIYWKQLA